MSDNVDNEKRDIEQMMTKVRETEAKLEQLNKADNVNQSNPSVIGVKIVYVCMYVCLCVCVCI